MRFLILMIGALTLLNGYDCEASPPGNIPLKIYIVSAQGIVGGRFVDTADFPKLGYIEALPALELERLEDVILTNQSKSVAVGSSSAETRQASRAETTIHIKMFPEDAKRFAELTTRAVGKRMLLTLGDEPLMAPRILSPISGPYLQLGLDERHDTTRVANALKALAK